MSFKTMVKREWSGFKHEMSNNYRDARKVYRTCKKSASLQLHGRYSDGKKKIKLSADRLIEACYLPGTADICIDISATRYCQENPAFITALNLLHCSVCASNRLFANDLSESDFLRAELERHNINVPFMGSPDPQALVTWIRNTFLPTAGDLSINVSSRTRKAALQATGMKETIRTLRVCRDEVAKVWVMDMSATFQSQEAYLANIWTFDTKFQNSHHSDIMARVEAAVNRKYQL